LRSAPSMVMASAGQATAHKPQAVHLSRPSSSRFKICKPLNTGLNSRFCSGYLIVAFLLKICLKVIIMPLKIFQRYNFSSHVIGLRSTGFTLFVNACMIYSSSFIKVRKNIFINPTYQLNLLPIRIIVGDNTNNGGVNPTCRLAFYHSV
jgi:hypothetical protein